MVPSQDSNPQPVNCKSVAQRRHPTLIGMTNYPIGPNRTPMDPIGPHRTTPGRIGRVKVSIATYA